MRYSIIALFMLCACSTNFVDPEVPAGVVRHSNNKVEPIFDPVIVRVWGYEESQPLYLTRDYYPQIKFKIEGSGLFSEASSSNPPKAAINIRWSSRNKNEARATISALLRAGTLFLVPDKVEMVHTMTIDVY